MNLNVAEKRDSFVVLPDKNGDEEIFYPESDGKPMAETDVHREIINYLIKALQQFFEESEVYVSGNLMLYYEEGEPRKSVSPDVMICLGVRKAERRVYRLWEEKQFPQVIFEISSRGTWKEDLQKKYFLYQQLGLKEYYIFDPEYDYLENGLIAYHLKDGELQEVETMKGGAFSPTLGLEVVDTGETLRLFNPETRTFLPTVEELARESENLRLENEKLKAELAKLKRRN